MKFIQSNKKLNESHTGSAQLVDFYNELIDLDYDVDIEDDKVYIYNVVDTDMIYDTIDRYPDLDYEFYGNNAESYDGQVWVAK